MLTGSFLSGPDAVVIPARVTLSMRSSMIPYRAPMDVFVIAMEDRPATGGAGSRRPKNAMEGMMNLPGSVMLRSTQGRKNSSFALAAAAAAAGSPPGVSPGAGVAAGAAGAA